MKTLIRCGALVSAVILGACSQDSTGTLATPLLNADIATVVADNTGDDVDIMREPVFFVAMPLGGPVLGPGTGDLNPTSCTYNASTQRLECPVVTRAGTLTITRSYAFWDANNVPQDHYDALLTAKANIQTHIEGERSGDGWSASIERDRDMTVTGLLGTETERTWNGTGTSEASRSRHNDSGEERSYTISCDLTVVDVVVPVPNGTPRFPISGTITHHCIITFEGGPRDGQTVERTAIVTFNGTATATVRVGDRTFDIDLTTRHRGPGRP
ncbi:MAG TPA: hypothetical protein VGQ69_14860 [Gemmatimonadales bacterium]|jgi:hypothetical protein|nr:hypothetical protein [Gemmatimonadales bacterium]